MWESASSISKVCGKGGKQHHRFPGFPQTVISTACFDHRELSGGDLHRSIHPVLLELHRADVVQPGAPPCRPMRRTTGWEHSASAANPDLPPNEKDAAEAASLPEKISPLVVILQPEVGDHLLAHEVAQRVLEFYRLNEQVVFRIKSGCRHRRLEVEAQPLLDADASQRRRPLRQIEKQRSEERRGGTAC